MPGTKTALFVRKTPGGVFNVEDQSMTTGDRWFVHSGTGTDGVGYGTHPDSPCATIDYAIGLTTASQGDVIFVMPGHAESITTATAINCDVAGISIIGLGSGGLIPIISHSAAAGAITIAAANVTLKNLQLLATFATGVTQAIAIAAGGDGCTLEGIQTRDTDATHEFLSLINVATTVNDLTIRNCSFIGAAGTLASGILFAGTTVNCLIEDNLFLVDSSDSVIDHSAAACVGLCIRRNTIVNSDIDTAKYCIELKTDCYGVVHDNRLGYNKVDAEVGVGAGCFWFENYASNTIAESGLLDPTTTHAIP